MEEYERYSDADLLAAAGSEVQAFAAFYRRHLAPVLSFFLARTGKPDLAADLASETFAAALLAVDRYDPGRAPPTAWLFVIARNELTDALRRGAVAGRARRELGIRPLALTDEDLERVEELAAMEPHGQAMLQLVEDLPAAQRHAVMAPTYRRGLGVSRSSSCRSAASSSRAPSRCSNSM